MAPSYEVHGGNTHVTSGERTGKQKGKAPQLYEVCGGKINKTSGEMTQEQKAKAYDDFIRGLNQPKSELGCLEQKHHQPKKATPPYPEEVVMIMDDDLEEDDGNSTMVSILSPATQWATVF
jgi:hypothetical protein